MRHFLHRRLPASSALLAGSKPPDKLAFQSDQLQIWFNRTDETWQDPAPHFHTESDEVFIVLRGAIIVEVEGERRRIEADELCAFPAGIVHSVVEGEVFVSRCSGTNALRRPPIMTVGPRHILNAPARDRTEAGRSFMRYRGNA